MSAVIFLAGCNCFSRLIFNGQTTEISVKAYIPGSCFRGCVFKIDITFLVCFLKASALIRNNAVFSSKISGTDDSKLTGRFHFTVFLLYMQGISARFQLIAPEVSIAGSIRNGGLKIVSSVIGSSADCLRKTSLISNLIFQPVIGVTRIGKQRLCILNFQLTQARNCLCLICF